MNTQRIEQIRRKIVRLPVEGDTSNHDVLMQYVNMALRITKRRLAGEISLGQEVGLRRDLNKHFGSPVFNPYPSTDTL